MQAPEDVSFGSSPSPPTWCAVHPAIFNAILILAVLMLFFPSLPSLMLSSRSESPTRHRSWVQLKGLQCVVTKGKELLYRACRVCQVVSKLICQLVLDRGNAISSPLRSGETAGDIDETPTQNVVSIPGTREPGDQQQCRTSALETIKAILKLGCDTKASFVRHLRRLMMLFVVMVRIAQSSIYWMLIASKIAFTMSARPPQNELDASSKQEPEVDTESNNGDGMLCLLVLRIAGREPKDYLQQYKKTLGMTKLTFKLVGQVLRSKRGEALDSDQSTDNNMLDPRLHDILVHVLDCLTKWIVHIGDWIGERMQYSFIMVIQGPTGTTQHVAGLDSGSCENLISQRSAIASGLVSEPYEGPLLDAIGVSIRPVGRVTLKWCVSNRDNVWYTTNFAVLDDGHCKDFNILLSKEEIGKRRFYLRNRGVFFCSKGAEQP
ncbi:MAG: hypothetical protein LQ337_001044 [Flavoplaca oasis]|nr:MAG: hypothetical protein LQ337_001044 [Flavoplaca oasis]